MTNGFLPMGAVFNDKRDISWQRRAACKDQDPSVYDTDDDATPSPAILCFLCEVRAACLTYALAGRESGTWGGMSRKERDRIIKRKRKARVCRNSECDSTEFYSNYGVDSCVHCGLSWETRPARTRKTSLNPAEV
jgi:hypothetical protein